MKHDKTVYHVCFEHDTGIHSEYFDWFDTTSLKKVRETLLPFCPDESACLRVLALTSDYFKNYGPFARPIEFNGAHAITVDCLSPDKEF